MERYNLKHDVVVYCTTAKSFPEGIQEAFITLEKMLTKEARTFYGISYQNADGTIIYKAAVSESFEGEAEKYGFETFIINKGEYLTETINKWRNNIEAIGKAFQRLLLDSRVGKTSPCVEWYKSNEEVICMVRMEETKT